MGISAKHRQEIWCGFRTTGNLLLGFAALVLLFAGAAVWNGSDPGRFGKVGAYAALGLSVLILYLTANGWKGWIAGFFGLPGVLASLTFLFSGHMLAWPYKPVAPVDSVLVLAFSLVLTIATYPLATLKRRLDVPNRLCLVFAVLAFAIGVLRDDNRIGYVWLCGCLGLCLLVRLRIAAKRKNKSHRIAAQT
jgi:hypothetical protein